MASAVWPCCSREPHETQRYWPAPLLPPLLPEWTRRGCSQKEIRLGYTSTQPTPVLSPGKSHGQRSLESDMTEQLHFHFSLSCIGEGNGNPLQCSCLENPWWAAVYGVAQSQTQLKWLSSSTSSTHLPTNLIIVHLLLGWPGNIMKWWSAHVLEIDRVSSNPNYHLQVMWHWMSCLITWASVSSFKWR